MQISEGRIDYSANLSATLIRRDGTHRKIEGVSTTVHSPDNFWRRLWRRAIRLGLIDKGVPLAAFIGSVCFGDPNSPLMLGLVTTAGVGFLATDMASGQASPRISAMNFHDSGTGTNSAATGDTTLQTQAGPTTRATGTQSNPSANQYRTVGTIAYTGPLAITEWGLFNQAAQGGTLWDRRTFSAVNVVNGDSIQFTYTLTINAGGS